jgi:hypothetical protein
MFAGISRNVARVVFLIDSSLRDGPQGDSGSRFDGDSDLMAIQG